MGFGRSIWATAYWAVGHFIFLASIKLNLRFVGFEYSGEVIGYLMLSC
jgi:hypothetical protein